MYKGQRVHVKSLNEDGVIVHKIPNDDGYLVRIPGFEGNYGSDCPGLKQKTSDHWWCNESDLQPIADERVLILANGLEVIAMHGNGIDKGTARCNPGDRFDFEIGAKLALERLMENRKLYNGQIFAFIPGKTHGKAYEVENGVCKIRDGVVLRGLKTLEEIRESTPFKYCEVYEIKT